MSKKTIDSFFKKRGSQNIEDGTNAKLSTNIDGTSTLEPEHHPPKSPRVEPQEFDTSSLIRDPGLRDPIWNVPQSHRDEVHRAYLEFGSTIQTLSFKSPATKR